NIVIKGGIKISLSVSENHCINDMMSFKADADNTIDKFIWDFGDGNSKTLSGIQNETEHKYTAYGTYDITLNAISSQGCINSAVTKTITISDPLLQSNFDILNKNALCSNNTIYFKDLSSIS